MLTPLIRLCLLRSRSGFYIYHMELLLNYFDEFTPQQTQQFAALETLYKEWNEKINVISRKDINNFYERHVLHSLSIAAAFDFSAGAAIVDIGTGGGFPGVPLAIYFPEVEFHLVDSIGKKLKVIEAVKEALGLTNLTTQHTRAEEIKGRQFDFAVSRAVAPLKELWRWSKPLLKNSTTFFSGSTSNQRFTPGLICLKGGDLKQEIIESGLKPKIIEVYDLFAEAFFKDKYLLYTALNQGSSIRH